MGENFADVLSELVKEANQTPGRLSEMTDIPTKTIASWLEGRVKRPRKWEEIVHLANALRLTSAEASRLLTAAGHKRITELIAEAHARQHQEHLKLLGRWHLEDREGRFNAPNLIPPETVIDFVGREAIQERIAKALTGGTRACAIQGMRGVGKSTLARYVARHLRPYFSDGILWADLDEDVISRDELVRTRDERLIDILRLFIESFGGVASEHRSLDNYQAQARQILHNKQALIVLDNVKHPHELEALRVSDGAACSLLVTTHDKHVVEGAMPQAEIIELQPFDEDKGADFLKALIAPAERHLLSGEQARELARLVEGHPLALRSLGGSLKNTLRIITAAEFIDLIRDNLPERLTYTPGGEPGNSVWATFNVGYWLLSSNLQELFKSLVVFRGPTFSAEAVAAIHQFNIVDALDKLYALAGRAFIEEVTPGRFRMHSLFRLFADRKVAEREIPSPKKVAIHLPAPLLKSLRATLIACGPFDDNQSLKVIFIDQRLRPWRDKVPEGKAVEARVDGLIDYLFDKFAQTNGRNALVLFLEAVADRVEGDGCVDQLTKLSAALEREINTQLQRPQSEAWLDTLWHRAADYFGKYAQANSADYTKLNAEWQNIVGTIHWSHEHQQWQNVIQGMSSLTLNSLGAWGFLDAHGHWYEAREGLEWVLKAAEAEKDIFRQAEAHVKLAAFAFHHSDFEETKAHLQESLRLLAEVQLGPQKALYQAQACELMAQLMTSQDSTSAAEWTQKGLDALQEYNDEELQHLRGYLIIRQATITGRSGQLELAAQMAQEGLALLPQAPTSARLSGLTTLGAIHYYQGHNQEAHDVWQAALADAQALGDRQREARLQQNLGAIYSVQGNYQASIAAYQQAVAAFHQMGDVHGESEVQASQAINYMLLGQIEQAWLAVIEALDLAEKHDLQQPQANALINRAHLQLHSGELGTASADLAAAERMVRELEDEVLLSECLTLQARLACQTGHYSDGLPLAEEAIAISVEPAAEGKAQRVHAELLSALGRDTEAEQAFAQSAALLAEQEAYELAHTRLAWSRHLLATGNPNEAQPLLAQALDTFSALELPGEVQMCSTLLTNTADKN